MDRPFGVNLWLHPDLGPSFDATDLLAKEISQGTIASTSSITSKTRCASSSVIT